MKIILKKLRLRNFKGIIDREIDFEGNTNIYGANESGKSTIYTAFNWLLTGKDEFDRKDFEIKNTVRKELNSQSHEVEAILITEENGIEQEHKLKRVYLEKWVTQRGQSSKTFEGHKTEYWWNEVPCNQSEFQTKVDGIIDSKILKLITNPNYFTSLKWDEQRRGLIAIAGEITNNEVIDSIATPDQDFSALINVLNSKKSLDEYKKELAAKKTLLKKKSVEYAPRIDEAKTNMPESHNWDSLELAIGTKQTEIQSIDNQLSSASAAMAERQKGILNKQRELHLKSQEIISIKQTISSEIKAKTIQAESEIKATEDQIARVQRMISANEKERESNERNKADCRKRIEELEIRITQARKDWDAANAQVFEFDESTCNCPTCKQQLPAHDIEYKKEELRTNFNNSVSKKKTDAVAQSDLLKSEKVQLEEKIASIDATELPSAKDLQEKLTALQNKAQELKGLMSSPKDIEVEIESTVAANAQIKELSESIKILTEEINQANEQLGSNDNSELKSQKLQLTIELDDLKKSLASKDTIERTEQRISQLEKEERENAQEIANIESQEFEIETFSKAKMKILGEKVNQMFAYVKWQLFETQVNGAVVETCVCTYNGVPYPTLNTAAKLLAGIDILNTLSNHYGTYAPAFLDNRESVSWIPESKSQLINLFVSPDDKQLRIESATKETLFA